MKNIVTFSGVSLLLSLVLFHIIVLVTTGFIVLSILFCMHKAVFKLLEFRDTFRFSSGGKKPCVENFSLLAVVSLSVFSELSQS